MYSDYVVRLAWAGLLNHYSWARKLLSQFCNYTVAHNQDKNAVTMHAALVKAKEHRTFFRESSPGYPSTDTHQFNIDRGRSPGTTRNNPVA